MKKVSLLLLVVVASSLGVAVGAVGGTGPQSRGERASDIKSRLLGSWQLRSFVLTDGRPDFVGHPYGRHPAGKLTYTADGQVWAYIGEGGAAKTDRSAIWYTGTFRIDARRREVIHRVRYSSIRAWEAEPLVRSYSFRGNDRLTLIADAGETNGRKTRLILKWAR
jgi:Lipocalin-like domain